jgi:hypothetical protein
MKRVIAAIAFLVLALPAMAEVIPLDQYIASLERIEALLAANQLDAARVEARRVAAFDVDSPQGRFHADASLLEAVANASRADVQLQSRVAVTIEEIRRTTPVMTAPADTKLLQRVANEQEVPELVQGGDVPVTPRTIPMMERIAQSLAAAWEWIADKLSRFLDWLLDFFPDSIKRPGATGGMRWIVGALVVVIVLLIVFLALEVRRRARRASPSGVETSEPLGSKRDEDPLSRGATEWERYAAQLADAWRFREAIRAWYHAVLVTCYSAGVLHYRKSRTNWEYVSALAPSFAWRPELIGLTRRFEREWYGSDQSSADALEDCRRRARTIIDSVRLRGAA